MNYDKFSFFNQQLAAMLKSGIPLEKALSQLCSTLDDDTLKIEFQHLRDDLAKGITLEKAIEYRKLPSLYVRILKIGMKSNDLPGLLTHLANHYQKTAIIWTKLKGLMFYPILVLLVTLALSIFLNRFFSVTLSTFIAETFNGASPPDGPWVMNIFAPILIGLVSLFVVGGLVIPPIREKLRWKLPAFKEASLSQLAEAISMLLRGGSTFPEALALMEDIEKGSPIEKDLHLWQSRLSKGHKKLADVITPSSNIPALFAWIIGNSNDDAARGFAQASDIYQGRARYRTELFLYSVLPVSVLALGVLIITQMYSVFGVLIAVLRMLGDMGNS
jgi:type II secretory pathway component PulF